MNHSETRPLEKKCALGKAKEEVRLHDGKVKQTGESSFQREGRIESKDED